VERRAARWGAPGLNIPSSARFFAFAFLAFLVFCFDLDIGIGAKTIDRTETRPDPGGAAIA
jgi:hypothetical protein